MENQHPRSNTPMPEALFIGDDLALDFINTSYGLGEGARECFRRDSDVADWLASVALPADKPGFKSGELLDAALALRRIALQLVEKRSAGVQGNPQPLNRLLKAGSSYGELQWPRAGTPTLVSRERLSGVDGMLLPVAQAVARLLAISDFGLVRKCEGPDCTLWFLDRTKAHSRRWCSPAVCGNRAKVAAFRARKKSA